MKNQKKNDLNSKMKETTFGMKRKNNQMEEAKNRAKGVATRNNKKWAHVAQGNHYAKAVAKQNYFETSRELTDQLMDGGEICLSQRHSTKSTKVQRRIMRRIAEKRLAQKTWRHVTQPLGRYISHAVEHSTGKCMADVRQHQFCI